MEKQRTLQLVKPRPLTPTNTPQSHASSTSSRQDQALATTSVNQLPNHKFLSPMAKLSSYRLWLASFAVAVAVAGTGATQFTVGGANGWSVPTAGAESFNTWAERTRFQVGDSLVFVYPKDQDSVLLVDPPEYNACNTSAFVQKFADGDTVFALDHAGAFFFISGVEDNCRNNEKLIVMVLAATHNGTGGGGVPAPTTPAPPPASSPPPVSSAPPSPPAPTTSSPPPVSSASPPSAPPAPKAPTAASPPPPATVTSAPPPAASAPTTPATPPPPEPSASSPAPASPATPPSAPAGAPPAPGARSPAPSAQGTTTTNSTGTPPSPPRAVGSRQKNGAALAVATGFSSSVGACVLGYAMLAL